jgi:superfamily I DNA/RNA helicase
MKHRLQKLLGDKEVNKITMMGTFHSVAVKCMLILLLLVQIANADR